MKKILLLCAIVISTGTMAQITWEKVASGTSVDLRAVDFVTENIGFAAGDSGVILKTVNGGEDWSTVNYIGISTTASTSFTNIQFVDSLYGFITGNNIGAIHLTRDGGTTWESFGDPVSDMCFATCVYPVDTGNVFVGGVRCFAAGVIDRYSNGVWGRKMEKNSFNTNEYVNQITFRGNVGFSTLNASSLLWESSDGGETWDTSVVAANITNLAYTDVMIYDNNTVYLLVGDNVYFKSVDMGMNWTLTPFPASPNLMFAKFTKVYKTSSGDICMAGRVDTTGIVYISEDNGGSWSESMVDQAINAIGDNKKGEIYIVGDNGYIARSKEGSSLSLPFDNLQVIDIYPNPAKNYIMVDGDLPVYNVSVYGINGTKLIEVDEEGSRTIKVDVADLEAGYYFVSVNGMMRSKFVVF